MIDPNPSLVVPVEDDPEKVADSLVATIFRHVKDGVLKVDEWLNDPDVAYPMAAWDAITALYGKPPVLMLTAGLIGMAARGIRVADKVADSTEAMSKFMVEFNRVAEMLGNNPKALEKLSKLYTGFVSAVDKTDKPAQAYEKAAKALAAVQKEEDLAKAALDLKAVAGKTVADVQLSQRTQYLSDEKVVSQVDELRRKQFFGEATAPAARAVEARPHELLVEQPEVAEKLVERNPASVFKLLIRGPKDKVHPGRVKDAAEAQMQKPDTPQDSFVAIRTMAARMSSKEADQLAAAVTEGLPEETAKLWRAAIYRNAPTNAYRLFQAVGKEQAHAHAHEALKKYVMRLLEERRAARK